jgi:hypothetical protein
MRTSWPNITIDHVIVRLRLRAAQPAPARRLPEATLTRHGQSAEKTVLIADVSFQSVKSNLSMLAKLVE